MTDRQFDLSRRKLLAGLGTAGVAAAGAGLGTTAYLSDTESFDDNIMTAGTLDLLVDYYSYWDQGMAGVGSVDGTADGEAVTATLDDVKPGDNGLIAFCPRIETNPAYLWLCGELTANDDNGLTEPEALVDGSGGDGEGELAQNVELTVSYCQLDEDVTGDDENDDGATFEPEDVANVVAPVWTGTLADFLATAEFGLPLDGGLSTGGDGFDEPIGFPVPGEQGCFAGTGDEATNYCLCLDWEVPVEVGNEIQSDSLTFDLQFFAEQCRHNDGTNNPCCACGPNEVLLEVGDGETVCVPVWTGEDSVEAFYQFGGGSPYASQNGAIQQEGATNVLIYEDGAGDRSLVVVHDIWEEVYDGNDTTGGTVSATFSGLNPAYEWEVRDDDPGNDSYTPIDSPSESVDWTWAANLTDGGAIGTLDPTFDIGIDLDLIDGIETVQYLTPSGDPIVIADGLANGDSVSTRLFTCSGAGPELPPRV